MQKNRAEICHRFDMYRYNPAVWLNKRIPSSRQTKEKSLTFDKPPHLSFTPLLPQPYLWVMDEVGDGPFEHGGGGFHTSSKDVAHSHEQVVVTEAHRLCTDLCCVVVLSAALGSQQSIQQVSLHMVTVVCLGGGIMSVYTTNTLIVYSVLYFTGFAFSR